MTSPLPALGAHRLWSPPAAGLAHPAARVMLERPPARARGASEQQLLDQLRRLARTPRGWEVLVLHLSLLPPPGALAHHRRIARALMQDNARLHEGQVFALRNGDLVLLAPQRGAPADLARLLLRLLRAPAHLATLWPLDRPAEGLRAYLTARLDEDATTAPEAPTDDTGNTDALGALVATLPVAASLHRQTAMLLEARMRPLFREISFSMAALEARLGLHDTAADPFLFRHLATRLDRRLLAALARAAGAGGPIDAIPADASVPPVHLNLTLPGILSADFTRFADACADPDTPSRPAIEVAFVEACADPASFAEARARLSRAGMALVLDGVPHLALLLARPGRLTTGLLKLDWSAQLPHLPAADSAAIDAAIAEIGPERIVLQRAGSETALHWGLARGIRRFQGRHVDAMQAAARITTCPAASACSLRQCLERASAAGPAGRHGCTNPALLDAALPGSGPA
jgi:hypothetical protein